MVQFADGASGRVLRWDNGQPGARLAATIGNRTVHMQDGDLRAIGPEEGLVRIEVMAGAPAGELPGSRCTQLRDRPSRDRRSVLAR